AAGRVSAPRADLVLAAAYAKALRELKDSLGLAGEPTVQDLAAMEGVISLGEAVPDAEAAASALRRAVDAAIEALDVMRRREGEALARDLSARLDTVEKGAREVSRLAPLQVDAVRERLSARIAELTRGAPLDPARPAQEVALSADPTDVSQELTRLSSHRAQARGPNRAEAPAGRM